MSNEGTLLRAPYVLPVSPRKTLLQNHAVRVLGGRIDALLPEAEALQRFPDDRQVQLGHHVLMPGLVNAHTHSAMSLLRGYADDLPLDRWLEEYIWPAENRWVSEQFVREGTQLALCEMIRGGTTCINEMYFFPDVIAQVVEETGFRAVLGTPLIDLPTPWASGMSEGLEKSAGLAADLEGHARMSVALAPHAPYSVDEAGLAAVAELARERQLRVAMHVLEADFERPRSLEYYGKGPLQRLQGHGLLGPDFMAVHMVQLRDDDIDCLVETGTHVIHCPESNLKLGNGACRVADLLDAGVNVALGTDGAASNNDLDMLGEARTAALLAKGMSGRPDALDAWQTLEMMTLSGARALGLGDEIGTIEVGKSADLCAIDLDDPSTQPLHSVPSQVVYSAAARQVSHVWVAGNALLDNHELTTIDLAEQMANAQAWQKRLANP